MVEAKSFEFGPCPSVNDAEYGALLKNYTEELLDVNDLDKVRRDGQSHDLSSLTLSVRFRMVRLRPTHVQVSETSSNTA